MMELCEAAELFSPFDHSDGAFLSFPSLLTRKATGRNEDG
jgi:hypothetical protein